MSVEATGDVEWLSAQVDGQVLQPTQHLKDGESVCKAPSVIMCASEELPGHRDLKKPITIIPVSVVYLLPLLKHSD